MRQRLKDLVRCVLARFRMTLVHLAPPLCLRPTARLMLDFDHVLSRYLTHVDHKPYYVQIGAFDGINGDPLYPYVKRGLLRGCLLEPQADVFARLQSNYAGFEGMTLKRAAVAATSGEATLYRVKPGTPGPEWLHQIASFSRETLLSHASHCPGLEQAIVTEMVPTISIADLIAELGVSPDIVVIDTEGFDFEVVKLLNPAVMRPRIIFYEHKHLSRADHDACIELLIQAGYQVAEVRQDVVAWLPLDE